MTQNPGTRPEPRPETWRLFAAVFPPADALDELAAAVDAVRSGAPAGVRWLPSEQWHLTVAFLGAVPVDALDALQVELAYVSRRHRAVDLRIAGAGHFGDRVLWAAVRGAADASADGRDGPAMLALDDLAGATARRAARVGVAQDTLAFKAHVTLARARDGADLHPLVEMLRNFVGIPWSADELCLVRSLMGVGPAGAPAYETVASWPLGPDGPEGSLPRQTGPSDKA